MSNLCLWENIKLSRLMEKGNVELQFTSRKKLLLKNVFHVLEIRKNLVSFAV